MSVNKKRFFVALSWAFIFIIIAVYNHFNIELTKFVPQCSFLKVTGLKCPGCGGTRSIQNLLEGNVWRSIKYNFIPIVLGGYLLFVFMEYSLSVFTKWRMKIFVFREWMLWSFGSAVIGFWIVRNIV